MKITIYNTIMAACGCFLLTDTWAQFWGMLFLAEALLSTVEEVAQRRGKNQ